ncbi:MAG: HNH endonuclease [Chloroflexi bacterium]|nr:HNH endonuclease [Chloroflexota bacterium]
MNFAAPVLVLNANYEPINICDVRRAVILVDKGKAEILENGRGHIRTVRAFIVAPSVIRLAYLVKRPVAQRRISRREIFVRDHHTCQYCGIQTRELTLDHVVPRRANGPHRWENVVAACVPCNRRKAGRTPEEARMRLLSEPRAPRPNPYHILLTRTIQEEWRKFIPWNMA